MSTDLATPAPAPAGTVPGAGPTRGGFRQHLAGLRMILVLTLVTGLIYPLAVTAIAQLPGLSSRADGSMVTDATGRVVGSRLIGQGFVDASGNPLPQWFQSRPSAAGRNGWDPTSSGASNLGPSNEALVKAINDRRTAIAAFDSVPGHAVEPATVPADAVTASGSGLDPDISPEYARQQAYRVARARHLDAGAVLELVDRYTTGRALGFLGEPTVNVLELNLALARLS
ncbi:MAG TPA: potassium-transporting ATPase subunit KdpC [Kineosporiaceae bacterium]|nr:potassium-transporting ATPase subunit KdpC [Kineosporiaceae bacterium]